MLMFVQPFGLSSPSGGPRIFRALLQDSEFPFLSICTSPDQPPHTEVGKELHLPVRPSLGRLERTRLAPWLGHLEQLFSRQFKRKLEDVALAHQVTGIHGLAHTSDFWDAYCVSKSLEVPFYLSVHDDLAYAMQGRPGLEQALERLAKVWSAAKMRFVISEAMGLEYCRRYGKQPFQIITDGLTDVASHPLKRPLKSLRVYFMGAVHLSYADNFRALLKALALLKQNFPDWTVEMIIRGGVSFPLTQPEIPIKMLPWATEAEVARDLDDADLLYLPLPFGATYEMFVRYSLSTKMVTYLGSGLPVLYHGPSEAAAGQLLMDNTAAFIADSLDSDSIYEALLDVQEKRQRVVNNALGLGKEKFLLPAIRTQFSKSIQSEKSCLAQVP